MSKIILDQNKCIGCNTCPLMDPETFEMDTTTYKAKVKKQPEKITDAVKSAVEACPVGAITIEEN
ncbi:MAG: ferredoxin [Candidatus Shapirobacteria bacterium]|nr:ferredoxin [Candidatus Shapirobacteria bacterium]MDD4410360.1 ferredoxin [Candidatus Shapirobacteria bacterium]